MAIKYKWLAEKLREKIIHDLAIGNATFPTEEELSKRYKVSRQTVRNALHILEEEHLITRRRGSGCYLTGLMPEQKDNTVGLLIYSDTLYIYPTLIEDIRKTLFVQGYDLKIFITDNQVENERRILTEILKQPLRGIIVEGSKSALPNPNLDLYHSLITLGTKLIFLNNFYDHLSNVTVVKDDNYGGAYALVKHFYLHGHTRIGCILHGDEKTSMERYQGFMEAMRDYGLTIDDKQILWFRTNEYRNLQVNQDTTFIKQMIPMLSTTCSAIMTYNDEIAYWLIHQIAGDPTLNLKDYSIGCFHNSYLSNITRGSLITLSHKPHEVGELVASCMIDKLKGLPVRSKEVPWTIKT
ncbi:MAG: GntR family transcriptional regulator [Lachnospiraceae bacterium]|nr:GntR family transcriptional regulator [Lachnospiraceae bacterium]